MIRFAFSVYDPDGMGHIQMKELEELLKMIHGPGFEVFANQALAQFASDDRDNLVKFDEFVDMNVRFPNLLYPVSRSTARIRAQEQTEPITSRHLHYSLLFVFISPL